MTTPSDPFGNPGPQQPTPGYGQQPYGQQPYGQQPYGSGLGTQTETKAIVALVLAIGSFLVFPIVPAIVALVLAGKARRDIDASGGRLTGAGLVTAAKVVAWVNLGLALGAFLIAVVGVSMFAIV